MEGDCRVVTKRESNAEQGLLQDEIALCVFQGNRQRDKKKMKIPKIQEGTENGRKE